MVTMTKMTSAVNVSCLILVPVILSLFVADVHCSRLFDLFLGRSYKPGYSSGHDRRPKSNSGGGYNEYRRICSVVNPHPYAIIGSNPYPAVPFCPP